MTAKQTPSDQQEAFEAWLPMAYRQPQEHYTANNMDVAFAAGAEWQAKRTPIQSAHANRSTGTVDDYLAGISRGETLKTIGQRYGIGVCAVRKALHAKGLPTTAAKWLRWKTSQESN